MVTRDQQGKRYADLIAEADEAFVKKILPVVITYIADRTSLEKRAKVLGYQAAAISGGFIIGPGLGEFIAELGIRAPFFFAVGFAFVVAVVSVFVLNESFSKVFSLFVDMKFGFTAKDIAVIITVGSILGVVVQIALFEKLVDKLGEKKLILIMLMMAAIFIFVTVFVNSYWGTKYLLVGMYITNIKCEDFMRNGNLVL